MKNFNLILFLAFFCSYSYLTAQDLNLEKEFIKIENYIQDMETSNTEVSEAPVKWHLLHSLQVMNGVINEAGNSNPNNYNSKRNIQWRYVSIFGKIPRNKVTAPDTANPSYDISNEAILLELKKAKESIASWKNLEKNNFYKHAVLLNLNKRKIRKFLKVHTRHHLKIVSDILKS